MSRSRKDRHSWKNKERKRTGKGDPPKIKQHRERFLKRSKPIQDNTGRYSPIVFRSKLSIKPDSFQSQIKIDNQSIGTLPFVVMATEDCHFLISISYNEFDPDKEKIHLKKHVGRITRESKLCALEARNGDFVTCCSVVDCRYRHWNNECSQPECKRAQR